MLENTDKSVEFLVADTTAFIENAPLQDYTPTKNSSKWMPITSAFLEAVASLKLGELLHVDSFTLSDAMTAIEMMDPKLDLGMEVNRSKKLLTSFDKAADAGVLKLDNFTEPELISIMDGTLASFVAFLEGSLETNLYLQKPDSIKCETLQLFCVCLQEILKVIKELVIRAAVYDDDFQLLHYEYTSNIDVAEEDMINKLAEYDQEETPICARIHFVKTLYEILVFFLQEQPVLLAEFETLLENASKELAVIKTTMNRLITLEVFGELKYKPEAAFFYLEKLLDCFKTISKISDIREYYTALKFFQNFSKSNPCTLSRSVLQLLYRGSNPYVMHDLLKDDSYIFVGPTTQQGRYYISTFLSLCVAPFGNLLKLNGFNQTRQRDKISLLLQEFSVLQSEAQKIDAIIVCFSKQFVASSSTWILYHTLQVMVAYLYKGFELELYSVHEYYYIYWYLSEFLYSWLKSALTKTNILANNPETGKGSRNKSKQNKKGKNDTHIINVHQEIVYYHAIQNMCSGYYQTLLGFIVDKLVKMPCSEFNTEEIRYNHRFEPFHHLGVPPYIQYSKFWEKTMPLLLNGSTVLYKNGFDHFSSARQLIETLDPNNDERATLIKICKMNCIVLKLLMDGYKKQLSSPPEFNFALHKCFPTVKFS